MLKPLIVGTTLLGLSVVGFLVEHASSLTHGLKAAEYVAEHAKAAEYAAEDATMLGLAGARVTEDADDATKRAQEAATHKDIAVTTGGSTTGVVGGGSLYKLYTRIGTAPPKQQRTSDKADSRDARASNVLQDIPDEKTNE